MKKTLFSILLITIFSFGVKAQFNFGWANLRGSDQIDYIYSMSSDNSGNIYNVGIYAGATNDFDPGSGTTTLPHYGGNGATNAFIQKLNSDGNLVWVKSLASSGSTTQYSIDIQSTANGDLFITGSFIGTVDFNVGDGVAELTSHNGGTSEDGYILKLDTDANYIWAKQFLSTNSRVQKVAIDTDGGIIATGWFEGAVDLDPASGTTNNINAGYEKETFILKLDANGDFVWGERVGAPPATGGNMNIIGRDLKIDNSGNIFVLVEHNAINGLKYTGDVNNTDFSVSSAVYKGGLILHISSADGSLINDQTFYGSTNVPLEMAFDSNNNLYFAGFYRHDLYIDDANGSQTTIVEGPGSINGDRYFTLSFTNDLTFRWGHGALNNYSMFSRNYTIAVNSQDQVVVGGFASDSFTDVDPDGSSTIPLTKFAGVGRMAQSIIYDTDGNYLDAFQIHSQSDYNQTQKLYFDNNDNLFVGGYIESPSNSLNPFGDPTDIPLIGGRDAFLVKLLSSEDPIVHIPDANFKTYLVGNTAINTNGDTEIQVSEASAYTGAIECYSLSISDLTGIEAFPLITELLCQANLLTNIDVTQNTNLTKLSCFSNQLTDLDITQNTGLTKLYCGGNSLTSLDVTNNTALTYLSSPNNSLSSLDITQNILLDTVEIEWNNIQTIDLTQNIALSRAVLGGNSISELDVTQNTALKSLQFYENAIFNIDLSQNTLLEILDCTGNGLSIIDVGQSLDLQRLFCGGNLITALDISTNTNLTHLFCDENQLQTLDVSANSSLFWLYCNTNMLTSLNVANGNNYNFTNFNSTGNSDLYCIQVDDATYSTTNWLDLDGIASFSEDCSGVGIETNEQRELSIYPNPVTSQFSVLSNQLPITNISIIDITGKTVKSINKNTNTVDVSDLQNGLYILKIQTENGTYHNRFIKE